MPLTMKCRINNEKGQIYPTNLDRPKTILWGRFAQGIATDQSGLPMTWLVPFFVPLLLAAEPSVGR